MDKLQKKAYVDGMTIVPLKVYFNEKNLCKIEIALCKGKKNYDKKESLKEKDLKMDMKRESKNY